MKPTKDQLVQNDLKLSIHKSVLIRTVIAVCLIYGLLTLALYNQGKDAVVSELSSETLRSIFDNENRLTNILLAPALVLDFISKDPDLLDALGAQNSDVIYSTFREIMLDRPAFRQFRVINQEGLELYRMDRTSFGITQFSPEQLQDKSDRYYFTEAINAPLGEIYISPIDLNIDPYEISFNTTFATTRIIKKIRNPVSGKEKLLLINYDLTDYLLNHFQYNQHEYLANFSGDWLLGPTPGRNWSYAKGKNYNLQESHPQVWQAIADNDDRYHYLSEGLWVWHRTLLGQSELGIDALIFTGTQETGVIFIDYVPPELVKEARINSLIEEAKSSWFIAVSIFVLTYFLIYSNIRRVSDSSILKAKEKVASHLAEVSSLANTFFDSSINGIIVVNNEGKIIKTNSAVHELFGYPKEELEGSSVAILIEHRFRLRHKSHINNFFKYETSGRNMLGRQVRGIKKNGDLLWLEISLSPIIYNSEKVVAATLVDLTAQHQIDDEMKLLSHRDPLTNLPNRKALYDSLKNVFTSNKATPHAILTMGIDYFSSINNGYGQEVGDQILIETAKRLRMTLNEEYPVFRISSDEFVVIIPLGSKSINLDSVISQVMDVFKKPYGHQGHSIWISATGGVSLSPDHGSDPWSLIHSSYTALVAAKRKYRKGYLIYDASYTHLAERYTLIKEKLQDAVEKKRFSLVFQAQIDSLSLRLKGIECLIRWHDDELGWISPAEFIPIAEQIGLINRIGDCVLNEACKTIQQLSETEIEFNHLSVNISALEFENKLLPQRVQDAIKRYGIDPQLLELEITESFIVNDIDDTVVQLEAISNMGVGLAIDDFGTGYSSLSQLRKLPFNKLKIDRSFIIDIPNNAEDKAIVMAITELAESLHLEVIIEGVETIEQLSYMQLMNCNTIQGYYFCKPLPLEQLISLYDHRTRTLAYELI